MRTQMLGKMALIQGLARGQEELRAIINQLHQDKHNRMKQAVEAGDQVIDQHPRRQDIGLVKSGPFQISTTSPKNNGLIRVSRIHPRGSLPNSTCHCLKLYSTC